MAPMLMVQYGLDQPLDRYCTWRIGLAPPKPLPNWPAGGVFPHVFVGDEAFPPQSKFDEAIPQGKSWYYGKDQTNF